MTNILKYQNPSSPLLKPLFKQSQNAYYDPNTDTVFAPDSTGEFYLHEMFHARPDEKLLQALKPYYHNLNDDVLKQFGADLSFVKRINDDPGHFYSPEELGARVVSANQMLKNAGISNINADFLKRARMSENKYGDNFRDLLHMYNDENLVKIFNLTQGFKKGGSIHIKKKNRGKFTDYCGGEVTQGCIEKGKRSSDPKIRKRATFADNARKWKHKNGGIMIPDIIKFFNGEKRLFRKTTPTNEGYTQNVSGKFIGFPTIKEQNPTRGLTRTIDYTPDGWGTRKDTLIGVWDGNNIKYFNSPHANQPLLYGFEKMPEEFWKKHNDQMDNDKQEWEIQNTTK